MSEQADFDSDTGDVDAEIAVSTDEDRMGADPLEDGMDTAEDYSREVKLGGTITHDEDTLAYRLPQEEPDPVLEEIDAEPERPISATSIDELDERVDDAAHSMDGVGGTLDTPAADGAVEDELLTTGDGEVELGLSSADGAAEIGGLPTDDGIGEVAGMDNESATEGAEQQALHIQQES